jgi:hypothetical protein
VGRLPERRVRHRRKADQLGARLLAIKSIIDAAVGDEEREVLIEALLVLGASEPEILAATLGTRSSDGPTGRP